MAANNPSLGPIRCNLLAGLIDMARVVDTPDNSPIQTPISLFCLSVLHNVNEILISFFSKLFGCNVCHFV